MNDGHFSTSLTVSLLVAESDPALPPDPPPVMTVVHHVLSAAAHGRGPRTSPASVQQLISIRPTESWPSATAGKLKMHQVIHPLNDSQAALRVLSDHWGRVQTTKDLDGSPVRWCLGLCPVSRIYKKKNTHKRKQKSNCKKDEKIREMFFLS